MINVKIYKKWVLIIFLIWLISALDAQYGIAKDLKKIHDKGIFSTWDIFEPDKCASIWLIQRFIDKNAEIRFFPRGEIITEGIPFDIPDARFRRYANKSTYETFIDYYKIEDPKLIYIGKLIHDIEINIWERKVMTETFKVQDAINKIILDTKDRNKIIEEGNRFFDKLYREIKIRDKL